MKRITWFVAFVLVALAATSAVADKLELKTLRNNRDYWIRQTNLAFASRLNRGDTPGVSAGYKSLATDRLGSARGYQPSISTPAALTGKEELAAKIRFSAPKDGLLRARFTLTAPYKGTRLTASGTISAMHDTPLFDRVTIK